MMTHAAGFPLHPELAALFTAQFADPPPVPRLRALKLAIVDEEYSIVGKCTWTVESVDKAFETVRKLIIDGEACYILFDEDEGPWVLMSFVPDNASIKQKMLYSSGLDALRKGLGDGRISRDVKWSDFDEVSYTSAATTAVENRHAALELQTDLERLTVDADRLMAAEAAGGKVTSSGLVLPRTPEVDSAVGRFAGGELALLVLGIEGEHVVLRESAAVASASDVVAHLPPATPCYVLYRGDTGVHSPSSGMGAVTFVYICPEETPIRSKMLHASSKAAVLQTINADGITVDRSFEGVEAHELTDTLRLMETDQPAKSDAAPAITKAAPRGGRKLIRKVV